MWGEGEGVHVGVEGEGRGCMRPEERLSKKIALRCVWLSNIKDAIFQRQLHRLILSS